MILIYLLKASACVAIFFAVYQLLLSKLTFFKLNRTYLLFALLVSFIIPVITVENKHEVIVNKSIKELKVAYSNDTAFEKDGIQNGGNVSLISDWKVMLEYAYYIVLIAFLMKTLFAMGYIRYVISKFELSKLGSIVFVNKDSKIKNCSFLNKIIVDSSLPMEEQELVIRHELIHVKQVHSLDKLFVNVATCVLWFNPIIYFWRSAMEHNHEFLADEATSATSDKRLYASLLLNLASPANNFAANNFSKLPLKKRIIMMYKRRNNPVKKLSYLVVIPVLSVCCMAFINKKDVVIQREILANGQVKQRELVSVEKSFVKTLVAAKQDSFIKLKQAGSPIENPNQLVEVALKNTLDATIVGNQSSINAEIKPLETGKALILVIDAGHGGKDGIAVSEDGRREKDLNLRAALILKEEADKRNIKVVLTRTRDKMIPLQYRLPDVHATAFISIHHNSTSRPDDRPKFEGLEIFVSKLNPNIKMAEQFGISLLNSLNQIEGMEIRDSLKNANLLLARESKIPAVVMELGNISSEKSLAYFSDETNLRRISNLILDGFIKFSKS